MGLASLQDTTSKETALVMLLVHMPKMDQGLLLYSGHGGSQQNAEIRTHQLEDPEGP